MAVALLLLSLRSDSNAEAREAIRTNEAIANDDASASNGGARLRSSEVRGAIGFSGCEEVTVGPVCELDPGAVVTLWLPSRLEDYLMQVNGVRVEPPATQTGSGVRVQLDGLRGGDEVEVLERGQRLWRLSVRALPDAEQRRLLEHLRQLGDIDGARELLTSLAADAEPRRALWVRRQLARLEIRSGDLDSAKAELTSTMQAAWTRGETAAAANDVFAVAFILLRQGELSACRTLLEEWAPRLVAYPNTRVLLPQHWATLARLEGRLTDALNYNAKAEREASRLGLAHLQRMIARERTSLLSELGDFEGALASSRLLVNELGSESVCVRANVLSRHAWLLMQQAGHGASATSEVEVVLTQAEEAERACGDPDLVVNGLLNRGIWALEVVQRNVATDALEQAWKVPGAASPSNQMWLTHLAGLIDLEYERPASARAHFERELRLGVAVDSMEARMRALSGLGLVHDAEGSSERALAAYQEAFAELRRGRQNAPLGERANDYFASHAEVASRLVEGLLVRGRHDAAFAVAREAFALPLWLRGAERARADGGSEYAALLAAYRRARRRLDSEAAGDWKLSNEQLVSKQAARRDLLEEVRQKFERLERPHVSFETEQLGVGALPLDELWLLPFPGRGKSWHVFIARVGGVEVVTGDVAMRSDNPLTQVIQRSLDGVRRVSVLATGASKDWDFERIVAAAQPTRDVPVVFRVTGAAEAAGPIAMERTAAVVADPREDLPYARREGEMVARELGVSGQRELSGSRATAEGTLRLLESSDWFHYAGHAAFDGGTPSLLVANGETLEAWELLSAVRLPRVVVLSACDAGNQSAGAFGASWNMATVFALRGTSLVVAPSGRLDDRESYAFQRAFYEALLPSERSDWRDVADTLWSVQQRLAPTHGRLFRMYVN